MRKLFEDAQGWFIPNNNCNQTDPQSLTKVDFKLRLLISVICFFYIFMEPCSDNSILSVSYCLVFAPVWMFYLYLVAKKKNDFLTGLLGLTMILAMSAILMSRGGYCLRLIGSSLGILAMFSVQGYSSALVLLMGLGYLFLQSHFFYHFENVYEPITETYRIPAVAVEGAIRGWTGALVIEILCLVIYQFTLRKAWSNYQKTQLDLKEANRKLLESNTQLSRTTDELALINRQLKQALNSQDLFVASVSHELRNPLNVMLGGLDLLESQTKGESQAQEIIKTSKICGDLLLSQVNNLLDVAKINAEKLEINTFSTKMSVFLDKFWGVTRIDLEKKGLSGCLIVDKKLPMWLEIDSLRLEQILNNLVGNAIKFTSTGSVRLTITWQKEKEISTNGKTDEVYKTNPSSLKIQQRYSEPNDEFFRFRMPSENRINLSKPTQESHNMQRLSDYMSFKGCQLVKETLDKVLIASTENEGHVLKIDIIDTGFGIPQEKQEGVFEPFIQADRSITRKHGGAGLGLYIARSLIEKMGGTIKITSMENIGTQFQIILPAKPTEQLQRVEETIGDLKSITMKTTRTQEEVNMGENGRVLIVDDDPFNQNLMKTYFKKFGFESETADNGLEGVQLYQGNLKKYSFITMDIQMPVMDGITACRMIRKHEKALNKNQRIPIIIITGNYSEREQKECLEDPHIDIDFFFGKPFRLSDCKACIQKILDSASSIKENHRPNIEQMI